MPPAVVPSAIGSQEAQPTSWAASLDGYECRTEQDFFGSAARALDFPDYFGHNWAAFDECLSDLLDLSDGGMGSAFGGRAGRPEKCLYLAIGNADHLLDNEPLRVLIILVNILRGICTAANCADSEADMHVYLYCAPHAVDVLYDRLAAARLRHEDYLD